MKCKIPARSLAGGLLQDRTIVSARSVGAVYCAPCKRVEILLDIALELAVHGQLVVVVVFRKNLAIVYVNLDDFGAQSPQLLDSGVKCRTTPRLW